MLLDLSHLEGYIVRKDFKGFFLPGRVGENPKDFQELNLTLVPRYSHFYGMSLPVQTVRK